MKPLFTLERKEFQLCDSRRLRKKAQDTQDAVLRFLKFSVSVALTLRLKFLRFLRFSVYYAIYNMNLCFDFFFSFNRSDKAFEIFLSNGDSGYYNTIRFFFCSNALIALARSLCKYLLAVWILQ